MQSLLALNLGFHWQMTHVEFANDIVHLHNIERSKGPPPR